MGRSLAVRIITILFYVLFGVSILFGVMFAINMNEEPLLVWMYVLIIAAIGITLLFAIANMFKDKKSALSSLLVIAIFAVITMISYALASDVIPTNVVGEVIDENLTAAASRWSGASLYMLYILLGASFVSLIYTEIRGAFK